MQCPIVLAAIEAGCTFIILRLCCGRRGEAGVYVFLYMPCLPVSVLAGCIPCWLVKQAAVKTAVLDGLQQVVGLDRFAGFQVGNRAGDF